MTWFAPGEALANRLRDTGLFEDVRSLSQLAGLREQSLRAVNAHVVYDGFSVLRRLPQDASIEIEQRWIVAVAVRHASGHATQAGVRDAAGPLLTAVVTHIMGWRPDKHWDQFRTETPPRPVYSPAFGYFPLAFTTRGSFHAQQEQVK
ncbi:MAG: hypothetical protein ABF296_09445 [Oceanococcaceae bacterium]